MENKPCPFCGASASLPKHVHYGYAAYYTCGTDIMISGDYNRGKRCLEREVDQLRTKIKTLEHRIAYLEELSSTKYNDL